MLNDGKTTNKFLLFTTAVSERARAKENIYFISFRRSCKTEHKSHVELFSLCERAQREPSHVDATSVLASAYNLGFVLINCLRISVPQPWPNFHCVGCLRKCQRKAHLLTEIIFMTIAEQQTADAKRRWIFVLFQCSQCSMENVRLRWKFRCGEKFKDCDTDIVASFLKHGKAWLNNEGI